MSRYIGQYYDKPTRVRGYAVLNNGKLRKSRTSVKMETNGYDAQGPLPKS